MVVCKDFTVISEDENGIVVRASLDADSKSEVMDKTTGEGIEGLLDTDRLFLGSSCFCADMEFGRINSSGVWTF